MGRVCRATSLVCGSADRPVGQRSVRGSRLAHSKRVSGDRSSTTTRSRSATFCCTCNKRFRWQRDGLKLRNPRICSVDRFRWKIHRTEAGAGTQDVSRDMNSRTTDHTTGHPRGSATRNPMGLATRAPNPATAPKGIVRSASAPPGHADHHRPRVAPGRPSPRVWSSAPPSVPARSFPSFAATTGAA